MRILIADDHEMIRTGMRTLIGQREGWEIVGEALNGEEAIALALQTNPHVAVIDYQLPGMNGPAATRTHLRQVLGDMLRNRRPTIICCWQSRHSLLADHISRSRFKADWPVASTRTQK